MNLLHAFDIDINLVGQYLDKKGLSRIAQLCKRAWRKNPLGCLRHLSFYPKYLYWNIGELFISMIYLESIDIHGISEQTSVSKSDADEFNRLVVESLLRSRARFNHIKIRYMNINPISYFQEERPEVTYLNITYPVQNLDFLNLFSNLTCVKIGVGTNITDDHANVLSRFDNLSIFHLYNSNITNDTLKVIGTLPIKELVLNGATNLSGDGLKYLSELKFETLKLDDTQVGTGLSYIDPTELSCLSLNNVNLRNADLSQFSQADHLYISACSLEHKHINSIRNFELDELDVSFSDTFDGKDLENIPKTVFTLNISHTEIKSADLIALGKFKNLCELSLVGCDIDNDAIPHLCKLQQDIDIFLHDTDVDVDKLTALMPNASLYK